MNARTKKNTNPLENYEAQIEQLEQIITALEQGELSLDQALKEYEQGIALIRSCQQALESAEQRVRILSRQDTQEEQLLPYHEDKEAPLTRKTAKNSKDSTAPDSSAAPAEQLFDDDNIPF